VVHNPSASPRAGDWDVVSVCVSGGASADERIISEVIRSCHSQGKLDQWPFTPDYRWAWAKVQMVMRLWPVDECVG